MTRRQQRQRKHTQQQVVLIIVVGLGLTVFVALGLLASAVNFANYCNVPF